MKEIYIGELGIKEIISMIASKECLVEPTTCLFSDEGDWEAGAYVYSTKNGEKDSLMGKINEKLLGKMIEKMGEEIGKNKENENKIDKINGEDLVETMFYARSRFVRCGPVPEAVQDLLEKEKIKIVHNLDWVIYDSLGRRISDFCSEEQASEIRKEWSNEGKVVIGPSYDFDYYGKVYAVMVEKYYLLVSEKAVKESGIPIPVYKYT